ncbi:MAG: glycosyltransferase family 39 protein [Acetatifactor sp.]|nr:glycosyltransferase family 39 protein [Acetatifactor sp.]
MYEVMIFLYPVFITWIIFEWPQNKNAGKFITNWKVTLTGICVFFLLDNLIILTGITLVKGKINIVEAMRANTRFAVFYLLISTAVAFIVGWLSYMIMHKKIVFVYDKINAGNVSKSINRCVKFGIYAVAFFNVLLTLIQCFDNNFWGDETYSITKVVASNSFLEVATCDSYVPPIYFLILKLVISILGEKPWVYHFASAIPAFILILFSLTIIKKKFGYDSALIFLLFLTMTDSARTYAVEVRMYSWAAMFVVLCFYESYILLETKGNKISNWILFCFFGLGAAYTHYFAFAAIILIYFCVFVRLIQIKGQNWLKCVAATVVSLLGYLPWISIFITRVAYVSGGDFWISSTVDFKVGINYMFHNNGMLFIYLLTIAILIISTAKIIEVKRNGDQIKLTLLGSNAKREIPAEVWMAVSMLFTVSAILIFQIVYGKIFAPVYVIRYLYPATVAVWLSFAICVSLIKNSTIRRVISGLLIVVILCSYSKTLITQIETYSYRNKCAVETVEIVEEYSETKNVYLLTDNVYYTWTVFNYYFPGLPCDLLDDRLKYDFGDADIVLVFCNNPINVNDYYKSIGKNGNFIRESFFADTYYYLYEFIINSDNEASGN